MNVRAAFSYWPCPSCARPVATSSFSWYFSLSALGVGALFLCASFGPVDVDDVAAVVSASNALSALKVKDGSV